MESIEDSVLLLEQIFFKLQGAVKNLYSENQFLSKELEQKENNLKKINQYKKNTLLKLKKIRQVLGEEIKTDSPKYQSFIAQKPRLNILMSEDEE